MTQLGFFSPRIFLPINYIEFLVFQNKLNCPCFNTVNPNYCTQCSFVPPKKESRLYPKEKSLFFFVVLSSFFFFFVWLFV